MRLTLVHGLIPDGRHHVYHTFRTGSLGTRLSEGWVYLPRVDIRCMYIQYFVANSFLWAFCLLSVASMAST